MKKVKSFFILSFLCGALLSGCGKNKIDEGDIPGSKIDEGDIPQENLDEFEKASNLANYCINIQNANSLGVVQGKKSRGNQETVQKLVKTTTDYSANDPNLNPDGTLNVTFTKIDTTVTTTIVDGNIDIIASKKGSEHNDVSFTYSDDKIILETDTIHQYRVRNKDNDIVKDWFAGTGSQITIDDLAVSENNPIESYKLDSRSLDAFISYKKIINCSYSVYKGNRALYTDINSNDSSDAKYFKGELFYVDALIEGEIYNIRYHYTGEETVITQSEIGAEIDKVFVYNEQFTFLSFVPAGTSQRPSDNELEFDEDGISLYDKCDYFSSNIRLSFVVDNNSGLIYKINNFNIKEFKNHLITTNINNFIYDFKIVNENLEIYAVLTNTTITVYDYYKDRYGNLVIGTDKLDTYDPTTNTTFYIKYMNDYGLGGDPRDFAKGDYWAYSADMKLLHFKSVTYERTLWNVQKFTEVYFLGPDSSHVSISETDTFNAINKMTGVQTCFVENGFLYAGSPLHWNIPQDTNSLYSNWGNFVIYNAKEDATLIYQYGAVDLSFSYSYLSSFNIGTVFSLQDRTLYYYTLQDMVQFMDNTSDVSLIKKHVVLENCTLENDSQFLIYGVHGNEYYDIVVEEVDGTFVVNKYLSGTYVAPEVKIVLQPIR